MRHLLEISQLNKQLVEVLISRATAFITSGSKSWPQIQGAIASLFYENSTRTKISFELAARQLGMSLINVNLERSSEAKGEEIVDTLKTLEAMGIQGFIFRHVKEKLVHQLSEAIPNASFINAGDGMHAHPTQTLTDLFTIKQAKAHFDKLRVVILGDILHSRVANSLIQGLLMMGTKDICLSAPDYFMPKDAGNVNIEKSLDKALREADVVVCLRVQKERIKSSLETVFEDYVGDYRLDEKKLSNAKPDVIVMHPGPMNRGVEITSSVADGDKSVILKQVKNGVFVRMAVLDAIFGKK